MKIYNIFMENGFIKYFLICIYIFLIGYPLILTIYFIIVPVSYEFYSSIGEICKGLSIYLLFFSFFFMLGTVLLTIIRLIKSSNIPKKALYHSIIIFILTFINAAYIKAIFSEVFGSNTPF